MYSFRPGEWLQGLVLSLGFNVVPGDKEELYKCARLGCLYHSLLKHERVYNIFLVILFYSDTHLSE